MNIIVELHDEQGETPSGAIVPTGQDIDPQFTGFSDLAVLVKKSELIDEEQIPFGMVPVNLLPDAVEQV